MTFFLLISISQHEEFSMPEPFNNVNSKSFLLPFLNGVLNTKTFKLILH